MAEKLRRRAARAIALSLGATATAGATAEAVDRHYVAPYAAVAPFVDGDAADAAWSEAEWRTVQHRWLGPPFSAADFSGRYKAVWTSERIYILFEFVDDVLIDIYADPLHRYWDDDTLEVFIDEDRSGGDHQYNHNAFAYHFGLDNRAIDIGTDRLPRDYTDHTESRWLRGRDATTWEVSIRVYPDSYRDDSNENTPVKLTAGKQLGFMLAYCDNDGSEIRENFIGSVAIEGQRDRGWIDAGVFGVMELAD